MLSENNIQEIWFDVEGYEGYYQYSNALRFRSVDRVVNVGGRRERVVRGKIIKISEVGGYAAVSFWKKQKSKIIYVHKFFAEKFIQNPLNRPVVNHKNGNKLDYSLSNLEWVTKGDDIRHAYSTGLRSREGKWGAEHSKAKPVLDTSTGIFYGCTREAAEARGMVKSTLANMLNGHRVNSSSFVYA